MSEIVKPMSTQQSIALRKKHFETLMARNRVLFMIAQHQNCTTDEAEAWLESEQANILIAEYENAFVEEQLVLAGLAEIVFNDYSMSYYSFYLDSDDYFHYLMNG